MPLVSIVVPVFNEEANLQRFHDAFIKLGPLPLPLIRKAMLGDVGALF